MNGLLRPLLAVGLTLAAAVALAQPEAWSTFNGQLNAQKYADLSQITPENVHRLKRVWQLHTGDMSDGTGKTPATDWSATPLFVNDTVYVNTPFYRVLAVAPDTGKVKWAFDPHTPKAGVTQPDLKARGVSYWQAANPQPGQPCQKIVYEGTMAAKVYALDADTGHPCAGFAQGGVLDVNQWNTVHPIWPLSVLQPPTVYKDTLFIGWAGRDWTNTRDPPGTVFAVDARTGALKWTFHAIPARYYRSTGTANVWASMSVDEQRGILYLPVSSPSPNFYGGSRLEALPYATAIVALDADTGRVLWSRQLVHHDLWDYDVNSAPVLVDLNQGGRTVPALIQSTKQGLFFVLNRVTGQPIFPIEERPAPASNVPGELAWPTQPYTRVPEPTVQDRWPGVFTLANIVSLGYCSREAHRLRYEGRFTPPSLGAGSLTYPATAGGVEWGGGAYDPNTHAYVVNSSRVVQIYQLLTRRRYDQITAHGVPSGYYAMRGSPYAMHLSTFVNWLGMPCWKPPYGVISAYNLDTGRLLWREPFGAVQRYGFFMPHAWGSPTIGGPIVTRTGVVFIGGSMDSRVRAIDERSGEVLWSAQADAPAVAIPATYSYRGRQYVVFAAGGNTIMSPRVGDQLVAYALPQG